MICPCGSEAEYSACCQPIINGETKAATAEQLMRARYSSFVQVEVDFLLESMHPDKREGHDPEGVKDWAENSQWHGLEILATEDGGEEDEAGTVEFAANYTYNDEDTRYHEVAQFSREDGNWYFVDGQPAVKQPVVRTEPKIGRNDPCPCGSGKKYKKCCGG